MTTSVGPVALPAVCDEGGAKTSVLRTMTTNALKLTCLSALCGSLTAFAATIELPGMASAPYLGAEKDTIELTLACTLSGTAFELKAWHSGGCGRSSCGASNLITASTGSTSKSVVLVLSSVAAEAPVPLPPLEFPLPPLILECRSTDLLLTVGDSEPMAIAVDAKRLRFSAKESAQTILERAWKMKDESVMRALSRFRLFAAVPSLGDELLDSARMLVARAHIAAGEWDTADLMLRFPRADEAHRALLRQRLHELQRRAATAKVAESKRLGRIEAPHSVAGDLHSMLFFRGRQLCVGEQLVPEPTPKPSGPVTRLRRPRMRRCFNLDASTWGAQEPYVGPSDDPQLAHVCGEDSPWKNLGPTALPCDIEIPAEQAKWLSQLAVVPGPATVYLDGNALAVLDDQGSRRETHEEVSKRLLGGPGSRFLMGATLVMHGRWAAPTERPRQIWPLLPEVTGGRSDWIQGSIVTSPDQEWIAAVRLDKALKAELWLFRVTPVTRQ